MKVIICGGRNYHLTMPDVAWLNQFHVDRGLTEVITGGARGADTDADLWAQHAAIARVVFPANREEVGEKAGPLRNMRMLRYLIWTVSETYEPRGIIAFPGGGWTADILRQARNLYVEVYEPCVSPLTP